MANRFPAHHILPLCLSPLCLAIAGCSSPGTHYPSLAIRDVERGGGVSGTIAAPAMMALPLPVPLAPTIEQLEPLAAQARSAHAAFAAEAGAAANQIAAHRGAPAGSEGWSAAQLALAQLRIHRSATMIALADLDRIFNDAASAGQPTDRIAPVRDAVAALVAEEDAVLDRLIERLGT